MIPGSLVLLGFLGFLVVGMPIAFAMGLSAVIGYVLMYGTRPFVQFPIIAYQMLDSTALLAVPLFIMMGTILLHGRVGKEFYNLAATLVGHRKAGLSIATILACAIFSAISASSLATAATIGAIAVPSMLQKGYPKRLVFGPVTAGGTLGVLIPPSGVLLLYGAMTDESVGRLFLAGMIPGLVLTLLLCIVAVLLARGSDMQPSARAGWNEITAAFRQAFWGLLLPVVVLGGLYSGLFTPAEAGAAGVMASLFITMVIKRTLHLTDMPKVLIDGMRTSGFIFGIIIAAGIFNHFMIETLFIHSLTEIVTSLGANQIVILICISILLFILGMFLEVAALVLVTVPMLYPIILALGIDPIWFGIFFVVNVELAYLTPPVGMNLFIVQEVGRRIVPTSYNEVVKSTAPYLVCNVILLVLLVIFPQLATYLADF